MLLEREWLGRKDSWHNSARNTKSEKRSATSVMISASPTASAFASGLITFYLTNNLEACQTSTKLPTHCSSSSTQEMVEH